MDSYIVRIYRRSQDNPDELAGLVEMVGSSERMSFKTFSELTSVLYRLLDHQKDQFVSLQKTNTENKSGLVGMSLVAGHKG